VCNESEDTSMKTRNTKLVYLVLLLGACSHSVTPPVETQRPDRDPGAAVNAIRAAGAKADSSVEVKPLRDPAVDGLIRQARDLEAQGQAPQALDVVRRAQKIANASPELIQYEAELLIEMRNWTQAETAARRSWELGPRVGALCARNQQTLVEARTAAGDAAGIELARQQLAACNVPAPARY
jgi:hypothetical protein